MQLRVYDAEQVANALRWQDAIDALRTVLQRGFDPDDDPARGAYPFGAGELLAMPSCIGDRAGVKLATVAPQNPRRGLPRVQAVYVLFDAATLAPVAMLDGAALTALRTPAVSALGVDLVAPGDAARLLVFGTGPQAYGHVRALRAVRPVRWVGVVARDARRTARFVERLRSDGLDAAVAAPADVASADLVACCTTAREPLFDGRLLPDATVVVACGSHEPDAREVDAATVRRGVLVESVRAAAAEAGDVILAMAEKAIGPADLVPLAALARGATGSRPRLVKTVGMGWEDLVVAAAVVDALGRPT